MDFGKQYNLRDCEGALIERVLSAAIAVHRGFGPGLLESVYQRAMEIELCREGMVFTSQYPVSAIWRGEDLGIAFRADIVVEGCLLLELKATQDILPLHIAQVINYLKLMSIKRGFILNFNVPAMKNGIKRISI